MRFRVILHEGVVPAELRPALESGLCRLYGELFPVAAADVGVDVTELPRGRFFTAGRPSTTSIIAGTVPRGTPGEQRTRLLSEITALWCDTTGCSPHQVVVSAGDAAAP